MKVSKYLKKSVVELSPYSSARDEYAGDNALLLDANENAFNFQYNRYPDPYQRKLKNKIAEWRGIDARSIFLGNGSDEVIDLLIRSVCTPGKDRILSLDPSYGMYQVSAAINEVDMDLVKLNLNLKLNRSVLFEKLSSNHKLVFICSPNNPNGGMIDTEIIEELLVRSKGLVVVDEAYIDFSNAISWIERLAEYDNLIVLQTMSKSLGAAGLRIGMAFMHPELVKALNKVKPPYNISIPSQEAALRRLDQLDAVDQSIGEIISERSRVRSCLEKMAIVKHVYVSCANFILVRFDHAEEIFSELKLRKIIVRNRTKERGCEGCLRITIGRRIDNDFLINTLLEIEKMKYK